MRVILHCFSPTCNIFYINIYAFAVVPIYDDIYHYAAPRLPYKVCTYIVHVQHSVYDIQ